MKESIVMATKTAIEPLGDQFLLVSWLFEHKDILSNVKINNISE